MKVIGTGLGRTGTFSLKLALEHLGFGKCFHMLELFHKPSQINYFKKAEKSEDVTGKNFSWITTQLLIILLRDTTNKLPRNFPMPKLFILTGILRSGMQAL